MTYSPLAIKRRNVLGNICNQCDTVESIPVYLDDKSDEPLGYADESLGSYADAFLFHLPEIICKKLSTSYFDYAFDFDFSDENVKPGEKKRIKLSCIVLVPRKIRT